jgi:hypothetical protein
MSGESFFPGFRASMIQARGPKIWTLKGGDGPPLLLLLGHPETHIAWRKIALYFGGGHSRISQVLSIAECNSYGV